MLSESRDVGHSGDIAKKLTVKLWGKGVYAKDDKGSAATQYFTRHAGQFIYSKLDFLNSAFGVVPKELESYESTADLPAFDCLGVEPYFMFYRAIQPSFYLTNGMIADGSRKAKRIHVETFLDMPLDLPSVEEQQKVASYFIQLDTLITLHQRKYDKLVQFKASMLENLFPKNGSNKPKIRFDGFTDAWEQRKFGDLGSVAMCKRIFKEQTTATGEIPFYKIGTFGGEPDAFISRDLFEEYKAKFSYPEVGDMLISASGTIGRTVEYTGKDEYFQDSNIVWFKHDDRIDNSFLRCLYSIVEWSGIEGSTIKRLYNDNFLKTEFMLPCVAEQRKVGSFFSQLDHLITLHQRK